MLAALQSKICRVRDEMERLFSYGTLRYASVQLATFGRLLTGVPAVLPGYRLEQVTITDPKVLHLSQEASHPILVASGKDCDRVEGMVFEVTSAELLQADAYEVADYKRISVNLLSAIQAWVYVQAKE